MGFLIFVILYFWAITSIRLGNTILVHKATPESLRYKGKLVIHKSQLQNPSLYILWLWGLQR